MKKIGLMLTIAVWGLCLQESIGQVAEEEVPVRTESDWEDGDELGDLILFEEPIDDVVERRVMDERRVLNYSQLSEADIFWEKFLWGIIDVREKINQHFASPKSSMFKLMLEGIEDGAVQAYTMDDFSEEMTTDQINDIIFDVDTTFVTNPETYEQEMQIVKNEINTDNIKRFRIKEVWYFDKKSSTMKVRVLGIAPIIDKVSEETETVYSYPMFWVYWPNARHYFARKKAYMPGNDATTISWDDIMEMRFFNYYITKESNVRDYTLADYPSLQGNDELSVRRRLLQSKKIKEEIFNFEQDLWSY